MAVVALGAILVLVAVATLGVTLARPASRAGQGAADGLTGSSGTDAPAQAGGQSANPSANPSVNPSASLSKPSSSAKPGQNPPPTGYAPGKPPSASGFPDGTNTGVPAGTALTTYTGPCTVTANNTVIDAKIVNCDLDIHAQGVTVKRSKVNGTLLTPEKTGYSFTLEDSEVNAPEIQLWAVGATNVTVRRANIHGGDTAVYCNANCDIRDSWLHGQRLAASAPWHLNGFLANESPGGRTNAVMVHNTIVCDAAPNGAGGCTGDVNLFGDFGPVSYVTVDNNLFGAYTGMSYCFYGGSTTGKPYDADHIVFVNNVLQRGTNKKCGEYGPVTAFDSSRPGNQWANNVWDDGTSVGPVR